MSRADLSGAALRHPALVAAFATVNHDELLVAGDRQPHELDGLAMLDHVTGVGNGRCLDDVLGRRLTVWRRRGVAFGVLVVEVELVAADGARGQLGDAALVEVARTLSGGLRKGDVLSRLNGGEFAVVTGQTTELGLVAVAERLHARLAGAPVPAGPYGPADPAEQADPADPADGRLDVAVGGGLVEVGDDVAHLLHRVGRRLLDARHAHRSRVVLDERPAR